MSEGQTEQLSKNAQKRLQKQQEKEKKQQERAAVVGEDEVSPEQYFENRVKQIKELKQNPELFPFPHKFELTHNVEELYKVNDIEKIQDGQFQEEHVKVPGRVYAIRKQGKKMIFMDIKSENVKVQVIALEQNFASEKDFQNVDEIIKRGDVIGIEGQFGKSKTGEASIMAKKIILLSPCLHILPAAKNNEKEIITC